jgi:hypothetical protein
MKRIYFVFSLFFILNTGIQVFGQTVFRSYYVRGNGSDENNGRSEETAFRTLGKAIEASSKGSIKTITVIGRVVSGTIEGTGETEVLITGKENASEEERAIVGKLSFTEPTKIKLEHIEISGDSRCGILIWYGAFVTIGNGVIIKNNNRGVEISDGTFTMLGNAIITANGNESANGGGIESSGNDIILIQDEAQISNNIAKNGGGIYIGKGTLTIRDNAQITNNSAINGGGICISRYASTPFVFESGNIISNRAEYGGGIYFRGANSNSRTNPGGETFLFNGGVISNNEADFVGGGVYIATGSKFVQKGGTISNNTAGDGEGENIFFQK